MSRFAKLVACAAAAWGLTALSAQAAPLSVVTVGAPAVNCVFNTTCTVTVTDSIGTFTPPSDTGTGRLQSRTYTGAAPAPAAGKMAYVYRIDMTGLTGTNCVTQLRVKFGANVQLHYTAPTMSDVFVVTSGGLGSVGPTSAIVAGAYITFNFATPVCPGQTSYFFGVTSNSTAPKPGSAIMTMTMAGMGTVTTSDRQPVP